MEASAVAIQHGAHDDGRRWAMVSLSLQYLTGRFDLDPARWTYQLRLVRELPVGRALAIDAARAAAIEAPGGDTLAYRCAAAETLAALKHVDEADRFWGDLRTVKPIDATMTYWLGRAADRRGDFSLAQELFTRAGTQAGDANPYIRDHAHASLIKTNRSWAARPGPDQTL